MKIKKSLSGLGRSKAVEFPDKGWKLGSIDYLLKKIAGWYR